MKALLLVISALIVGTSEAFALGPLTRFELRCETPWPTATTWVETTNDIVRMRVSFHYGSAKIPLRMDSVSAADLEVIQSHLNLVKSLDQTQIFEWNISDCTARDRRFYRCQFGKQILKPGSTGLKVDQVTFFTTRLLEEQGQWSRTRYFVELWLTVGQSVLRVSIPYDQLECQALTLFGEDAVPIP